MVRRIFAIVLIVLGLGTIGAAIASGTIWRPDDRVTLTLPTTPDVPLVITAPGVLNAVDDEVDVHLVGASADTPVMLAMARESDVLAWVGDAPHWEITGLTDWDTLAYTDSRDEAGTSTSTGDGTDSASETPSAEDSPSESTEASSDEPAEESTDAEATDGESTDAEATDAESTDGEATEELETVPNPSGSDLWVEEVDGTGELDYSWTAIPGRWVMLIASDGTEPAPQVELTWDRPVETPFVRPGVILGSVVLLLGLGLLILQILTDLEKRRARRAAAAASTGEVTPVVTADGEKPLTRREIRLAEQAQRRGGKPASSEAAEGETESIPAVGEQAPSAASPETEEAAAEEQPADEAGELDAWVRGGAASPLLHEGERTTPADLALDSEASEGTGEEPAQEAAPSAPEEPRGWWRRRSSRTSARAEQESPEAEPEGEEPEEVEPTTESDPDSSATAGSASGDTDEIPATAADEDSDPQEWGAEWRQTWGLTTENKPESTEEDR